MPATDRLFFALFPPAQTATQVYSLQQDLRIRHGLWGRPMAMDRLHVMLCHVGDYIGLPHAIVAKASEAASRVSAASFDVTFDRALTFSGRPRNCPFVLRSSEGAPGVQSLQCELGKAMTSCGLGKFVRPYTPHMTLLYDTADVGEHAIDPITWLNTEFRLIHSLLGQTRLITLGAWTLKGAVAEERELLRAG